MTEVASFSHNRLFGTYRYSPVWYFIAGISLILTIYGSAYVLWIFHTYYLHVDSFARTVFYVMVIDIILIANPLFVFMGIRIRWWWSMPLAILSLFLTLGSFVTSYDILILASVVNISLSIPRKKRIQVISPEPQ